MKSKICTKCGIEKKFDEFTNMTAAKDGKKYRCKTCELAIRRTGKVKLQRRHHDAKYNESKKGIKVYKRWLKKRRKAPEIIKTKEQFNKSTQALLMARRKLEDKALTHDPYYDTL